MKKLLQSAMLASLPYGIIGFFVPLQSAELGATPVQTGFLFSVFTLLAILIRPWVGRLADRAGRKPVYILALLMFCVVQTLYLLSVNYWGLLLARVVQALAMSLFSISLFASVADLSSVESSSAAMGSATGRLRQGEMLGFFLGFTLLANGKPFSTMYTVFLMISLLALVLAFVGFPKLENRTPRPSLSPAKTALDIRYRILVCGIGTASAVLAPVLILFVRDNLVQDPGLIATTLLPGALVGAILPVYAGKLADKFGPSQIIPAGLVIDALAVAALPHLAKPVFFAVAYAISALGVIFYLPALKAMAADSGSGLGFSYGNFFMLAGLGGAVGAVLGGWLYQSFPAWVSFAVSGLLLMAMAGWARGTLSRQTNVVENNPI